MRTSPKLLQWVINNGFMAFILHEGRLLYKFLKQKRCLKQFVENRVRLRGDNCPNGGKKKTTEGHNFWSKLEKEYTEFIEKNLKII